MAGQWMVMSRKNGEAEARTNANRRGGGLVATDGGHLSRTITKTEGNEPMKNVMIKQGVLKGRWNQTCVRHSWQDLHTGQTDVTWNGTMNETTGNDETIESHEPPRKR
ncbi:hypothetical protein R1flu_006373 [Riccia fluitans]|uniref:Uncharacterized protein n=1 Tax=Riccia fluitans TaxID=41844 RepID=A0ABD1YVU2_9MARC